MVPQEDLQRPVLEFCSTDFPILDETLTTGEAIELLRARGLRDQIIYFYVADKAGKLAGVLPAKRLLTDPVDTPVAAAMIRRVVAIPSKASLLEACEFFVLHNFLAFPVVDAGGKILGVLDVRVFTGEVLDLAEREQMKDLFQSLGFRVSALRSASAWRAFALRFPCGCSPPSPAARSARSWPARSPRLWNNGSCSRFFSPWSSGSVKA